MGDTISITREWAEGRAGMFNEGGIVTTTDWIYAEDGQQRKAFFCHRWEIKTDAEMPIEGFRSSERWSLFAIDVKGNVRMIIPGCKVIAFVSAKRAPKLGDVAALT